MTVADLQGVRWGRSPPFRKEIVHIFAAEKVKKWVDITSNGLQNALFDLDRPHSPSNRPYL